MMNEMGHRRTLPEQSSGSGHTFDTARHMSVINAIQSKRVCFYKSGDPQFNGLRMVINNRTFKTFDALLDSLSKKVPLPFGVRNITTPRGVHGISTLEELEDGKSYLCSDSHKVKPFNLALAQRKLPPWYHARPVSSRRRTAQQAWFFPGRKNINKQKPVLVHTPKRLVVFRNGDPSVNHTVVLPKKTTPTYESILSYLSDLMQFHVNKLHTPDGRRVDGLPGLILCSGTVVAVGREPFRPATYRVQKSPAPRWQHPNQKRLRGQKVLKYRTAKKKSSLNSSRSRNFSASSERHIVHQIHNSIAESSCDLPSNLSNSVESGTNCILESGAGFEGDTGDGAEGQDSDNIEKSFRVNQDGSMTVEMKVRLTVKEEETVQWTTTLTRSAMSDQLNVACLPESEAEQEIHLNKSNHHSSQSSAVDSIHKHRPEDDDEPPSLSNGTLSDNCHEEDDITRHTNVLSPWRAPTPGCKQINKQQASIESIKRVTIDGIKEGKVASYTYGEKTENRTMEQSCTVNQSNTRPVPKPRRLASNMTEIVQSESSGEEVTETVLHIYEQQTCQDNFLANVCAHGLSASGVAFQAATSETGPFFELCGPSTASKSVSICRADLHRSSLKTNAVQRKESKNLAQGPVKAHQKQVTSVSSKSINKHAQLVVTPRKRQKKSSKKRSEKHKRVKPFSSAVFIKRIYGNKSSSAKKLKKPKKKPIQHWDKGMTIKSLPVKTITKDSKLSTSLKTSTDFSQTQRTLTRQTSVHHENRTENELSDKSTSLPPFNSSSSVTKDYVEKWLEKSNLNPESNPDKEHQISDGGRCGERKEVTPETFKTSERENLKAPSVKLRVRSYENKSGPSVEKTATSYTTATKPENCNSLNQQNTPVKPLWNGICTERIPPSDETLTGGEFGNSKTQTDTFSMELPPPPPELLNAECFERNISSMDSSPLYRLSSTSSLLSDNYPLPMSPPSEKSFSPSYPTAEKPSAQADDPSTPKEAEISQTPSIKRATLFSNESLERKMSLRKSSLDKHTSGNHVNLMDPPISTVGHTVLQQEVPPPEETQLSVLGPGSPSVSTSGSPASLTSDERLSTASIFSSVASPKTLMKRVKLKSSSSPERKLQNKKSVELQNTSPKLVPVNSHQLNKAVLPKVPIQKRSAPNGKYNKPEEVLRESPPVRHKANLSVDTPSQSTSKTQKKTSSQTAENKAEPADRDESLTDKQVKPEPLNTVNQPNMKPVLEKICCSIKSLRQITQTKRLSCLEKSNSLPDFSSHVASTFGSSSKALLAFLAVMTLKEGLTNRNVDKLNANNVSCAEALKMIDSLREIANIEDSQMLKTSLSNLQQLASKQLLLSWKGFQEIGCKSQSPKPLASELGLLTETGSEQDCGIDGNLIDEIIDNLDIPAKLKEELDFLSEGLKSETENEEKTSAGITGTLELTVNQHEQENTNSFPSKDAEVDVRSIIKKFTDISQAKQSKMDSLEAAKVKPDQAFEDYGGQHWPKCVTKCPSAESKQRSVERQRYCTTPSQSGNEEAHQEHQRRQQLDRDEKLTEEKPNRCGDMKNETNASCSFKPEEKYMDSRQLMMQTEENELSHDSRSDSTEETSNISHADEDVEKNCAEVSDMGEQSSSANEREVVCKERKQRHKDLSNFEIPSKKKHLRSDFYAEVNLNEQETKRNSEDLLEKERAGTKCEASESPVYSMGLNISTDESTGGSDAEEPSSEEEQTVAECKKLQVIMEESFSGDEEEQDEEPFHHHPNFEQAKKSSRGLEALREETEEDQVSSEDDDHHAENPKSQSSPDRDESTLFENQDLFSQKYNSSLIISENAGKDLSFNSDDSGNNHSSCEEHGEELKDGDEQTSSLIEEELSYYEKQSGSEEEQANTDRNRKPQHLQNQEAPAQLEERNREEAADNLKHQSEVIRTQSVAKRVILLEKQVAEAQRLKNSPKISTIRSFSQRKTPAESDDSPSDSPTSESALCTRSAPQSSLSFSYDSSGVVTTEPEGSRVRSIREMFLAKSPTDIQQRCFPSPNSSDLSELQAETSASGGYQSQTSGELSSGEDDSSRKSIAKGFVRRTIEMLYGKKDARTEEVHERTPSEPNQRTKEPSSIFSPFHAVRSKAMSELSYFNSTGALDAFSEATRCIAFNAQVGPGDSVPAENRLWILRENTQMRKSASDPIGINKTFTDDPQDELCKDLERKTPYSLFSTKPELEDKTKTLPRKCTYFSLPHASESEVCQDDLNTLSKSSVTEGEVVEATDASEDTKTWAERNSLLPGVSVSDFKMKDNKVHPLVELPPEGEVVVVQPGKGQGVVNRRVPEPDVLDFLYHFCGEHCPVL